jgi:hypothetical protein
VLQKELLYVNAATKFAGCDDESITIASAQAANLKIGTVLVGTLASFDPKNATNPCSWIVRKVTGITPGGTTTRLSTVPATFFDIAVEVNATIVEPAPIAKRGATKAASSWFKIPKPSWNPEIAAGIEAQPMFAFAPEAGLLGAEVGTHKDANGDRLGFYIRLGFNVMMGLKLKLSGGFANGFDIVKLDLMEKIPKAIISAPLPCIPMVPAPTW